jgi:hypothetical protein
MALDRESAGGDRYDGVMAEEVHVTLSGGLRGRYVLKEKLTGGRVVLAPETSAEAILARLGHEPATLAEFEAEHGPVRPPDGEG